MLCLTCDLLQTFTRKADDFLPPAESETVAGLADRLHDRQDARLADLGFADRKHFLAGLRRGTDKDHLRVFLAFWPDAQLGLHE